jgi:Peptidase A4 family/Bacterial Ig-like domain (group 3)
MHNPRRLLWALGILTLLAGTFVSVAQSEGATPSALATEVGWGTPQPLAASQPHSQPVQPVRALAPHLPGTEETLESTNWSGYVDTEPGAQFTGASGQWIVPSVQPSQTALYSATWVGVDGYGNEQLIQTGTAQDTSGGSTDYYAWLEILPAASIRIGSVSPGDHMQASVARVSGTSWVISITDLTSGSTLTQPEQYTGPGASAEWIEEAPTVNGDLSALANFGTAQFTNIGESVVGGTSSVTHNAFDMIDGDGNVIAAPGALANSSFTVTDSAATSPPVTPAASTTTMSVSPTSTTVGGSVAYSASVTSAAGTPTGSVSFSVGSTALCTVSSLSNGSGSCTASTAPAGNDTITAHYSGTSNFAASSGSATLRVTASAPTHGYWLVGSDGGIFTFGSGQFYGSTAALALQRPVVGMTPTADKKGYWLVASDGGVFAFGDAGFFGSIPGMGFAPAGTPGPVKKLNAPIVGMVPSPDGGGYFMVASDGGVFAFGDAKFEGSCPGIGGCSGSAVTVMPDATGDGYSLVTASGHVYSFGDAGAFGAPGPQGTPVTSAVRTPDGAGYWILFANGVVDAFGDAQNLGTPVNQTNGSDPATAIFATDDGGGYWVASAEGAVFTFGDAPALGNLQNTRLNGSIIAGTGF